jgi:superfamily I DNA/RNA helicase
MNWSEEQLRIFEFFEVGKGNLVVEALAGTGKTTTIKAAFEYAREQRMLYAVFNKRNQKEAEAKIKDQRVEVRTLHSLGYSFIKRSWPSAKPDPDVEYDRILAAGVNPSDREMIALVNKLIGFAKNTCINPTLNDLASICIAQDLDFGDREVDWCQVALNVLAASKVKDSQNRISFDDMVWLPCALGLVRPQYDLVCIDEAQDMNLPQLTMARQACKPEGRVVVVGDSRQAIYGFRGAVQNGMGMMKTTLRAATLKLTTTYRCPKLVVAEAAKLVPEYKAAQEAPEGLVKGINQVAMLGKLAVGDSILSRLNAPLMPLALSLLRKNIPARIEGRDIGKQLIGMIRNLKAKSIPDLIKRLEAWEKKQVDRIKDTKNAEKRIEQIHDIAQTLSAISEGAASIADAETRLANLFQDSDENSKPAVVLSSVHKAKGLEWKRVFLLSETFRASKGGEEANIYYVAITRAMRELYLVGNMSIAEPQEKPAISEPQALAAPIRSKPPVKKPAKLPPPKNIGMAILETIERLEDKDAFGTPNHMSPVAIEFDNLDIPPGQVRREVGDVFLWAKEQYVVTMVSLSRSVAKCLNRSSKSPGEISVSNCCDKADVLRKHETNLHMPKSGVGATNHESGIENNNKNMKAKNEDKGNPMAFVVSLAKRGNTEKEITSAYKANYGAPSPNMTYVIGREWRRVNKAKATPAKPAAKGKAPTKAAAKAPVKKGKTAPAAKKGPKAPPVAKVPPPRPPVAEPAQEGEGKQEVQE